MKNVVVIGGGTGTFTVLTALKAIPNINITAIVASTDSGGSTGVLRDHFGQLPVGDFRQCLVALAQENGEGNILRELFQYRFDKGGGGLEGHNFGNLFITALKDVLGSEEKAFRKASRILNVRGRVFPITFDDVQLVAQYEDGSVSYGEAMIDEPAKGHDGKLKITKLWTQPEAKICEGSKKAILDADFIIVGPGDLYTSILANFVVKGALSAVRKSGVRLIYISNLVSKYGQTHGFAVSDYIKELKKYLGRNLDIVLIHKGKLDALALKKYAQEKTYPVVDDIAGRTYGDGPSMKDHPHQPAVIRQDFLLNKEVKRKSNDMFKRSLLRHDPVKLRKELIKILF